MSFPRVGVRLFSHRVVRGMFGQRLVTTAIDLRQFCEHLRHQICMDSTHRRHQRAALRMSVHPW